MPVEWIYGEDYAFVTENIQSNFPRWDIFVVVGIFIAKQRFQEVSAEEETQIMAAAKFMEGGLWLHPAEGGNVQGDKCLFQTLLCCQQTLFMTKKLVEISLHSE